MKLKENLKRVIAVLISANMIFSQSVVIFAESNGDESQHSRVVDNELSKMESWDKCTECSEEKPHIIRTKADLDKIRTHKGENKNIVTGYFKLANDIVFSEVDFDEDGDFYNNGYGWIAIGKDSGIEEEGKREKYFTGVFDGNNYSIENLTTRNQVSLVGLFGNNGSASDRKAVIKNLTMRNCIYNKEHDKTKQNGRPMGTVAANNFGTISNVRVDGSKLYAAKGVVGGICGGLEGGKVENCNVLKTTAHGIYIGTNNNNDGDKNGLIAGYANNNAIISNCTVKDSSVEGEHRGTGGIVGIQYSSEISDCTVDDCNIKGTTLVGGISGGNYTGGWESSIKNCKVLNSTIKGKHDVGGIEGSVSGGNGAKISIENSLVNNSTLSIYGDTIDKYTPVSISGIWSGQGTNSNDSIINRCIANNITVDLSEREGSTSIAGIINYNKNGNCSISDTFVNNMNIVGAENKEVKVAGVANESYKLTLNNVGYVNNSSNTIKDFGDSDTSNYSISTESEAIEKEIGSNNNEIKLEEIFNTENVPSGDNIVYKSSNEDVLKVENDKVLIKKDGEATISLNVTVNGEEFELAKQDFNITIQEDTEVVVNGNQPYKTIEEAIVYLEENDKLEICKDITIEKTIEINKNNVVLDFKNHKLSKESTKSNPSTKASDDNCLIKITSEGVVIQNANFDLSNGEEVAILVDGSNATSNVTLGGAVNATRKSSTGTEKAPVVKIVGANSGVTIEENAKVNGTSNPSNGTADKDNVYIIVGTGASASNITNNNKTNGGVGNYVPSKPTYTHEKIEGLDRYETAAKIADKLGSYDNVVLVNAESSMSDGLAASGLAGKENGAILLTKKDSIPKVTMDRLKKVKKVYIIGGENAISKKVSDEITKNVPNVEVERLGGKTRVETSELVAKKLGNYNKAFVVNGFKGEADAMSASSVAAKNGAPILLTNGKTSTHAKKAGVEYYVIGGDTVVDKSIATKYDAEVLAGSDRYATNREVINEFYSGGDKIYFANGETLVDALTASTLAKKDGIALVNAKSDKSVLKGKDTVQVGGMKFTIDFEK